MVCVIWISFVSSDALAYRHVHPAPSLPSTADPLFADDVYSNQLVTQIHRTLFRIAHSVPVPDLVAEFSVSEDQLEYRFVLGQHKFHDGKPLKSVDVKYSIERFIKSRAVGYRKLVFLQGYQAFINGDVSHISGVKVSKENPREVTLQLNKEDGHLLHTLAEYRLSIVSQGGDPSIGLGSYTLASSLEGSEALIERASVDSESPSSVLYVTASDQDAVNGFAGGKYHDLFAYSLNDDSILKELKPHKIHKVHVPRVYFVAANSSVVRGSQDRRALLSRVDYNHLLEKCYKGSELAGSLVPPGFAGYSKHKIGEAAVHLVEKNRPSFTGQVKVLVAHGVGNESCVEKVLAHYVGEKGIVEVVTVSDALQKWEAGAAHLLFAYLEADNALDFYQFFNPTSQGVFFGERDDQVLPELLDAYHQEVSLGARHELAMRIESHIFERSLVRPVFHPSHYLVYQADYKPLDVAVVAPSLIRFDAFRKEVVQ